MASTPNIEVQAVAEALSIHPFMLSRWKKEYREGRLRGRPHAGLKEVQNMEEPWPNRSEFVCYELP